MKDKDKTKEQLIEEIRGLRESEEKYRSIAENTNDALVIHDFEWKILDVNKNTCKLLGYKREELVGGKLNKFRGKNLSEDFVDSKKKKLIKKGKIAKGDVLAVAQLSGITAAKQTSNLIPLCHPLLLGNIKVEFGLDEANSIVGITATVTSTGKTGVEMEALTATAIAALTIYDMCKAVDRGMKIENIRLVRKSGGKSGTITLE